MHGAESRNVECRFKVVDEMKISGFWISEAIADVIAARYDDLSQSPTFMEKSLDCLFRLSTFDAQTHKRYIDRGVIIRMNLELEGLCGLQSRPSSPVLTPAELAKLEFERVMERERRAAIDRILHDQRWDWLNNAIRKPEPDPEQQLLQDSAQRMQEIIDRDNPLLDQLPQAARNYLTNGY